MKPLALDLCCGLGGWAHGLLAEGWDVIGYDIERHDYGTGGYPGQLVIQDIRTLDGTQFRGKVSLVVASPPCTEFSYMAMPWRRGKQIAEALRGRGEFPKGYKGSRTIAQLRELFDACVRIGREAGCPTVIENVRGAQPWIGRARWNFGSYYLFGDVPALMPITQSRRMKSKISCSPRQFSDRIASTPEEAHALHYKLPDGIKAGDRNKGAAAGEHKWTAKGMNWSDRSLRGQDFTRIAGQQAEHREISKAWRDKHYEKTEKAAVQVSQDGVKGFTPNGEPLEKNTLGRKHGSKSPARKAASAQIAKIPFPLARWIAHVWKPKP